MSDLPILGGIEVPANLLEFVKDIALDFDLKGGGDETAVADTVEFMNRVIMPVYGVGRAVVKASRVYTLPYYDADVEIFTDDDVLASQLPESVVEGKINYVQWFASMNLRSFGLRMVDAHFIEPDLPSVSSLFVPLEAVDIGIVTR